MSKIRKYDQDYKARENKKTGNYDYLDRIDYNSA